MQPQFMRLFIRVINLNAALAQLFWCKFFEELASLIFSLWLHNTDFIQDSHLFFSH